MELGQLAPQGHKAALVRLVGPDHRARLVQQAQSVIKAQLAALVAPDLKGHRAPKVIPAAVALPDLQALKVHRAAQVQLVAPD